ncbi:DUF998 domain-containing protein [Herbiconiux flava]|uniref:DUF998 domain-containing protein n=1 Tax=Herbiconiux flava TaxID=881268 RepID=A0A852SLL0_9MICO|nr:DUF998 domain-containing protein [Herbiconiux flava]NYD69059.1 hypothetical protein [Herbiconiux flava]GLK15807.1 hypothetical protein GCM10017602_02890 [Herbiconiux flava]
MTRARAAALTLAAALAAAGLVLIWVARLSADRYLYVSELGAAGEPTADVFRWAMTAVAVGAAITALALPAGVLTPRGRALRAIPPAVVLLAAAAAFGLASQVTCTRYCPLPVGPGFTWQDLVHTSAAVVGFAGASWVMLQVASDARLKRLARFSLVAALAVALIAATGGILSLLRFGTEVGGLLELVATTVALTWLVGLSLFLAIETASASPVEESRTNEAVGHVRHSTPERVDLPPAVY